MKGAQLHRSCPRACVILERSAVEQKGVASRVWFPKDYQTLPRTEVGEKAQISQCDSPAPVLPCRCKPRKREGQFIWLDPRAWVIGISFFFSFKDLYRLGVVRSLKMWHVDVLRLIRYVKWEHNQSNRQKVWASVWRSTHRQARKDREKGGTCREVLQTTMHYSDSFL